MTTLTQLPQWAARCKGAPSKAPGILHNKCTTCTRYVFRNDKMLRPMWAYGFFDMNDECDIRIEMEMSDD